MILIAGGEIDPSIESLARRREERGIEGRALRVGPTANPSLWWDFGTGRLLLDGEELRPDAVFLRYDVFHGLADPRPAVGFRAQAWFHTVLGWALAHDGVRLPNRFHADQGNKPFMLRQAHAAGLRIPFTWITNDLARLDEAGAGRDMIAKPVPGGGYTQLLAELLQKSERRDGRSAAPAFVQERLVNPEVRIYGVGGIGGRFIPFHMRSDSLDYRSHQDAEVIPLPLDAIDPGVIAGLGRLMERLGLDWGAADFKTHAETGELVFMEINSSPMFAAFDAASGFAVSDAILDLLTGR